MSYLLLAATFLPFLAALLSLVKNDRKYTAMVSTLSLLLTLLLIVFIAFTSKSLTHIETYPWQPLGSVGFQLDGLSLPFFTKISLVERMISVSSYSFMENSLSFWAQ